MLILNSNSVVFGEDISSELFRESLPEYFAAIDLRSLD